MNDADLRLAVIEALDSLPPADDAVLIEELGLRHGAVRLDIAVVNGRLEGYELKSEQDSLRRLPRQAATYGEVLDRMTLVAASKHLGSARDLLPPWWGIVEASVVDGGVVLTELREARANPRVEPAVLAKLLWRDEALEALEEAGNAEGLRSATRSRIYARLTETLELRALRSLVRNRLRRREGWRPDGPRRLGGD